MTTTKPHCSAREFTVLMALLMSIVAISIDAMLPALGFIGRDLSVTPENHTQLTISFIFAGMAIGQLIAGPLSDALGRKPILFVGIGLYLVGSVICYLAQDFTMLLIGRFIEGLGVAGPYVSAVSVVRDKYQGSDMAKVMSLVMMIFIIVPALAPSIGQAILHIADWRSIFLMYIAYAIAVGAWIHFRLEETLHPEYRMPMQINAFAHGFMEVMRNGTTTGYMTAMGLMFGALISYLNSSRQIFQEHFAVAESFTLYFGGLALLFGVASLANSHFVARFGMRNICHRSMSIITLSSLIFLGMNLMMDSVPLPLFIVYVAVVFFCFGLMFGNLNAIAMEPMGHIAGMASAIIGSVSSIISLTIGTLIGQMYNNTLIPMTGGFLVLSAAALSIMLFVDRKKA